MIAMTSLAREVKKDADLLLLHRNQLGCGVHRLRPGSPVYRRCAILHHGSRLLRGTISLGALVAWKTSKSAVVRHKVRCQECGHRSCASQPTWLAWLWLRP